MTIGRVFAGLMVLAGLGVVGCGGTVIDSDKLEDEIKKDAEAAGLVIDEADCPSPDAKKGESFTCTVTVKGEETDFEVNQEDDEGNVEYTAGLTALLTEASGGGGAGGDEASVSAVIETVNTDITTLCDFSTDEYKAQVVEQTGNESCEDAVSAEDSDPIEDYEVTVEGDTATVVGTDSGGERTVTLERAGDGSWLIAGLE